MFWVEIIPNIIQYELLEDEMRDYFGSARKTVDTENENLAGTLLHNEPKGDGIDFKFFASMPRNDPVSDEETEIQEGLTDEMLNNIKEAFSQPKTYLGNFTWGNDSEPDENTINIVNEVHQEDVERDEAKLLVKTFQSVLRFKNDSEEIRNNGMSVPDMMNRLKDPNFLSDMSCFNELPAGFGTFISEMPFFQQRFEQQPPQLEDPLPVVHSESSSLNVPEYSSSSQDCDTSKAQKASSDLPNSYLSSESFSTSRAKPSRSMRSNSSSDGSMSSESAKRAAAVAKHQMSPKPDKPRSRKQQVEGINRNPRMQLFMEGFVANKRNRDSLSPEVSPKSDQK